MSHRGMISFHMVSVYIPISRTRNPQECGSVCKSQGVRSSCYCCRCGSMIFRLVEGVRVRLKPPSVCSL